jgi:phospholipid transport system substrate-binding protein
MRGTFLKKKPVMTIAMQFIVALAFVLSLGLSAQPAVAASPSEQFVADNVQKGLTILNNAQSSKDQRRTDFRAFLLNLTDIKVIAEYTLGQYRRTASPDDINAYDAAFRDYAMSVYQSYFTKYSGQTLQVTGSYALAPDESVVKTVMVDAKKPSSKPLEVNFRVLSRGAHMVVVDFSVEGVWIRELERNDFTSFLGQNGGNVALLTQNLRQKSQQFH